MYKVEAWCLEGHISALQSILLEAMLVALIFVNERSLVQKCMHILFGFFSTINARNFPFFASEAAMVSISILEK